MKADNSINPIKLTKYQEAFAKEVVLNNGDKVAAFKKSGYKWETYTQAALAVQADKVFNHPNVNLKIQKLQSEKEKVAKKEFQIDAEYVLGRMKDIDAMDVMDILDDDLNLIPLSQWPKTWRTSISGIDLTELQNGTAEEKTLAVIKKIKWPDKVKNLEMLGRHFKMFTDKIDITERK